MVTGIQKYIFELDLYGIFAVFIVNVMAMVVRFIKDVTIHDLEIIINYVKFFDILC
jgi:hypothetical protein